MGVSIGVHGRRVPGPIVLLSVVDGIALMVVRQQSVQLADIVVIIQFQFQCTLPFYMYLFKNENISIRGITLRTFVQRVIM
jgi:hypothetical protein